MQLLIIKAQEAPQTSSSKSERDEVIPVTLGLSKVEKDGVKHSKPLEESNVGNLVLKVYVVIMGTAFVCGRLFCLFSDVQTPHVILW